MNSDGDFLIFEGNRYSRKGFLYKAFPMNAIVSRYSFRFVYLLFLQYKLIYSSSTALNPVYRNWKNFKKVRKI